MIFGHAYQPPREDPNSPSDAYAQEVQYSKKNSKIVDWNDKITRECYTPNAVLGNFSRIGFDLAPTLANYLAKKHPQTLEMIAEQDERAIRMNGAGTAIAHPYHHIILPLASDDEIRTEIRWGIGYFRKLFGRNPLGMWFPEAAVDDRTLEIAADEGIKFTVLGGYQLKADDYRQPYEVQLQNGGRIAVFPFHEISGSASYDDGYTMNADSFLQNHLIPLFDEREKDQFVMMASDMELYGHHKSGRDKFLEYLTSEAAGKHDISVSYPELWLASHSIEEQSEIYQKSAWSCSHDLARWVDGCDCTNAGDESLNSWKKPLFDTIASAVSDSFNTYNAATSGIIHDSSKLLFEYINVILGEESSAALIGRHKMRYTSNAEELAISLSLESMEAVLASRTSCAWFFESEERPEPNIVKKNMQYAKRKAQDAKEMMRLVKNAA